MRPLFLSQLPWRRPSKEDDIMLLFLGGWCHDATILFWEGWCQLLADAHSQQTTTQHIALVPRGGPWTQLLEPCWSVDPGKPARCRSGRIGSSGNSGMAVGPATLMHSRNNKATTLKPTQCDNIACASQLVTDILFPPPVKLALRKPFQAN